MAEEEDQSERYPSVQSSLEEHRRKQDFGFGRGAPGHASVVHTCEAVAGSWGSGSAPAVSRVMGGALEGNKNSKKKIGENTFGEVFL